MGISTEYPGKQNSLGFVILNIIGYSPEFDCIPTELESSQEYML